MVVALVVDQLSAWVADERLPHLPSDGGFAKLRREGTWAKIVRFPYAVTDTAPGHAALFTGKTPSESGVWGNELPDSSTGRLVSLFRDESTKLISPDGLREVVGRSAERLRVETVADRLRAAHPDALVVSVSVKDRGAIVPAGKRPSFALWFDSSVGSFVTSTAFGERFPSWATEIAGPRAVERARATPWTLSDPAWLRRYVDGPDDAPGEGDLDGLGRTFPHVATSNAAFRALPASDAMIFDVALAAIDAEHSPARPTLLLLSLSASDIVGHVFGPDSWEAWDHLYKLDASLGRFLEALERRVGDVAVVLGADHGNSSMPEVVRARRSSRACDAAKASEQGDPYQRPVCVLGSRIDARELEKDLVLEIDKALGSSPSWIVRVADPYVFLSDGARALSPTKRAKLDAAVRRVFARRKASFAELFDVRTLAESCPDVLSKANGAPHRAADAEALLTLVCRSWAPNSGAGDFYMVPRFGHAFGADIVPRKGGSHGGPYLHDRTIPMFVRAKGLADEGLEVTEPVDFTAYAKIVASLLGLDTEGVRDVLASSRAGSWMSTK